MDFDDLDDAAAALGPTPDEIRAELLAKQVPEEMPGARKHPAPADKGYGGGNFKSQKVLYLHGPGSNAAMAERQVSAMFKNVPWVVDFKIFEWHYYEGKINQKVEEIHADPAVAALFIPYGKKCGSTYDGYLSYICRPGENRQDETWLGPSKYDVYTGGKEVTEESTASFSEVMQDLADHLEKEGPFDGICGFDMGGALAFEAAKLAQEGDARFMSKFRYLMLFSVNSHRACAMGGQGSLRPKAPLMIPTFIGWSLFDDARPYPVYEDLALYIHPRYRGVFYHDQGHRPPNIQKGTTQCAELDEFVGRMQADTPYAPTDCDEHKMYKDYWLPLIREPLPEASSGSRRVIFVITDPLGEHGPEAKEAADRMRFPAQESPQNCATRLAAFRAVTAMTAETFTAAATEKGMEVIDVPFKDEHKELQWHPVFEARDVSQAYQAGQGRSRWLLAEDEVVVPWDQMRMMAEDMLSEQAIGLDDTVSIVGIGTGALVALMFAEALIRIRSMIPYRFYGISAPTVWPLEGVPAMGALVSTPVRYFQPPAAVTGPNWRLETSTFGEYAQVSFQTKEELIEKILADMA